MFWGTSKKKPESHGCCHYCLGLPAQPMRDRQDNGFRKSTSGFVNGRRSKKWSKQAQSVPVGYRRYIEVESGGPSLGYGVSLAIFLSALLLILFSILSIMMSIDVSQSSDKQIGQLVSQVARRDFRASIMDVEGVMATIVLALAALSWVDVKQPRDRTYMRMWINDVNNSGKREQVVFVSMLFLSSSFGALVLAFWVSLLAEGHSKGVLVGGDALIGAALAVASVVIWVLPLTVKASKNNSLRGYILLLGDITNYMRASMANPLIVPDEGVEKPRIGRHVCLAFAISALPAGKVWILVGGAYGVGVVMGFLVGVIACGAAFIAASGVVECAARTSLVRLWAVVLLIYFFFSIISVGFAAVLMAFKWGWRDLWGIAGFTTLMVIACFWWCFPVFVYVVCGRDVPILRNMTAYFFAKKRRT